MDADLNPSGFIPDDQFVPDEDNNSTQSNGFVSDADFKPDDEQDHSTLNGFVADKDFTPDDEKYTTPGQQALTIGENLAKGFVPGISTLVETKLGEMGVPGLSPEDIKARSEANPIEAAGSELAGNTALLSVLPELGGVAASSKWANIGSKAIDAAIKMGLISSGDELSKSLLGIGDPEHAVAANIAENAGIGLLTGGAFAKVEDALPKALKALENNKVGTRLKSFIAGIGHAASYPLKEINPEQALQQMSNIPEDLHPASFKMGQDFYNAALGKGALKAGKYIADVAALKTGSIPDVIGTHVLGTIAEKILGKTIPKVAQKTIGPVILKLANTGSVDGLAQGLDHAMACSQGAQKISKGIESLFESTGKKAIELNNSDKDREDLRNYVENTQPQDLNSSSAEENQNYASGGEVNQDIPGQNKLQKMYPEQNILMSAAKNRIFNYLNAARPIQQNKLPFDINRPNPNHKREYDHLLDMANQPLSILNEIKGGTLTPQKMKHFTSMYPELHNELSKKIMSHIADKVHKEERPKHALRQSLSLFLGQNLDSTLSQSVMMAAQSTFIPQQSMQPQPQGKKPKSKESLSNLGKNAMTSEQSRDKSLNKV